MFRSSKRWIELWHRALVHLSVSDCPGGSRLAVRISRSRSRRSLDNSNSAIAGSISCRSRIEGPQLRALEIQKVSRKRGFIGNGIAALDDDGGGSRFAIRRKSLMFRDEELVDLRRFDKIGCCVQARRIGDGEREAGMA